MERIEVNIQTGECSVIEMTQEEIDAIIARAPTASEIIKQEISVIEQSNPITHRALRELILAIGQVYPQAQSTVFYQKVVAAETLIDPLRAQL